MARMPVSNWPAAPCTGSKADGRRVHRAQNLPRAPAAHAGVRTRAAILRSQPELHGGEGAARRNLRQQDRKSTRLNSSHPSISYAVFCLKKKTQHKKQTDYIE